MGSIVMGERDIPPQFTCPFIYPRRITRVGERARNRGNPSLVAHTSALIHTRPSRGAIKAGNLGRREENGEGILGHSGGANCGKMFALTRVNPASPRARSHNAATQRHIQCIIVETYFEAGLHVFRVYPAEDERFPFPKARVPAERFLGHLRRRRISRSYCLDHFQPPRG